MLFRPVPGYEDLYASIGGTIVHALHGELVAKPLCGNSYLYVYIPGVGTRFVHRLVSAAYLGERPAGMQTRHGDSDKANNGVGNLCYGTASDNTRDAINFGHHGAYTNLSKTHCPQGHVYAAENLITKPNGWRECRSCQVKHGSGVENRCRQAARRTGENLTRTEKNTRVDTLVLERPELSNRAVAARAGVSHTTVRRRRTMLSARGEFK